MPWLAALAADHRLDLHVGFGWLPDPQAQGVGFDRPFAWDVPLLDGYRWSELPRRNGRPQLSRFFGIRLRGVGRWLREQQLDALVATGWNSYALVQTAIAARRLGVPLLVRGDSHDLRRRGPATRLLHRAFLKLFDGFLVVGKANRRFYRRRGVPESRLFDCPHFVDNERFAAQHAEALPRRASCARAGAFPTTPCARSSPASWWRSRTCPRRSAALRVAVAAAPRLHLLIVGDGPLSGELKVRVVRDQLPVSFTGFLNQGEIAQAYAAADFLLLPSRSETWGLVVNEAMACGLPAIVSDGVGCAEDLVAARRHRLRLSLRQPRGARRAAHRDGGRRRGAPAYGRSGTRASHQRLHRRARRRRHARRAARTRGSSVNVLHVIPTYVPAWRYGGPMRSVHGLASAQAAAGDRVSVYTTNVDGPDVLDVPVAQPVRRDGVEVWYFPVAFPRRLARSPAMARALHDSISAFDVVHLHSVFLWPTVAAARVCHRIGLPYVLSPRGMLVGDLIAARGRLRKALWLALFERRTVREAAAIVVSSELEARELAALDLEAAYVEVVPNGLSADEPEANDEAGTAKLPALPADGRPLVLYLGRLSWKKGVDVAIRALVQLPDARLAVAGNDDEGLRPRLEALAAKLGIAERVTFLGEVRGPAKQALLASARVLVMPSISENFGIAALEAIAAGVPAVLSRGVGLADAVEEAGAGVVCERTPEAFAVAVTYLLAHPEVARAMGERGRRLAADRFSWPAIATSMRLVYECAIAAARATAPAPPRVRGARRAW